VGKRCGLKQTGVQLVNVIISGRFPKTMTEKKRKEEWGKEKSGGTGKWGGPRFIMRMEKGQ